MYLFNLFLTPLLCVLLSETVYYIFFCNQRSCFKIDIAILRWPVLHILDIHLLIFDYMHLCMNVKGSMCNFKHNIETIPLLYMDCT